MNPKLRDPIEIQTLGAQGDGVAVVGDLRIFVPFTLPGETVRAEITDRRGDGWMARLIEIVTPSPQRIAAPCRHFGVCGGCMLQHMEPSDYHGWKRGLVETALHQRGLDLPGELTLIATPPATRRRARFAAARGKDGFRFGFHEPESEAIVDITDCRVLSPSLLAQLPLLRELSEAALGTGQSAVVTASETETGLDVLIAGDRPLERRRALVDLATKAPIARLCWQQGSAESRRAEPEPLLQHRLPRVTFGGVGVDLPPDAFLQPSLAGETALVEAVTRFAKGKAIADLYSGCGTFTFPLAKLGKVAAFEAARPAVAAIVTAANHAGLSGRVTATARNLDSSPLPPELLKAFDCVVFDPPRGGAKTQAEMLVKSKVKRVVAVSCNPASFARDARILADGGFALKDLVAIDQFVWSPHVEVVALFRR